MKVAVIIPSFKVRGHILDVLSRIGPSVDRILVVDDCCPEESGRLVESSCKDSRVRVLFLPKNEGVGGATLAGFAEAAKEGATILVKLDGDGQMDPALIPALVHPIRKGLADFVKGNRFSRPSHLRPMPWARLWGNSALCFIAKASTGYWKLMDPTNGFIALHREVFSLIELPKVDRRFFFETDLLYRLGRVRAFGRDFPMQAVYGSEKSNLNVLGALPEFFGKHLKNLFKRIVGSYFVEDFNAGSIQLALGMVLVTFGTAFGAYHWVLSAQTGITASTGTVMIATLPWILGFQLLLSFLNYDIGNQPERPVHLDIMA